MSRYLNWKVFLTIGTLFIAVNCGLNQDKKSNNASRRTPASARLPQITNSVDEAGWYRSARGLNQVIANVDNKFLLQKAGETRAAAQSSIISLLKNPSNFDRTTSSSDLSTCQNMSDVSETINALVKDLQNSLTKIVEDNKFANIKELNKVTPNSDEAFAYEFSFNMDQIQDILNGSNLANMADEYSEQSSFNARNNPFNDGQAPEINNTMIVRGRLFARANSDEVGLYLRGSLSDDHSLSVKFDMGVYGNKLTREIKMGVSTEGSMQDDNGLVTAGEIDFLIGAKAGNRPELSFEAVINDQSNQENSNISLNVVVAIENDHMIISGNVSNGKNTQDFALNLGSKTKKGFLCSDRDFENPGSDFPDFENPGSDFNSILR